MAPLARLALGLLACGFVFLGAQGARIVGEPDQHVIEQPHITATSAINQPANSDAPPPVDIAVSPPVWPSSFTASYFFTLPYVQVVQTQGLRYVHCLIH